MFSLEMSKEQKMIKNEVARLVKDLVTENARDMEDNKSIPGDSVQKAWELGASVSMVPEEYGGFGMEDSPVTTAIILEELAYGDMAFAISATLPSLAISPIAAMGTKGQQDKYLPIFCAEKYPVCTLALTEPRFGFDAMDLATTAVKKDNAYVLNGTKCFVPLAETATHIVVAAGVEGKGNLFIVDRKNPGITVSEREKNLGLYSLETYEVTLTDCEIPEEDRIGGDKGCNYDLFIQKAKTGMAAIGTGLSRASFEFSMAYAKERVQFGEPIVHKQSVAFMIAEMGYEVDAMRLMTWNAASALENGIDAKRRSFLAKHYVGEMSMKVTDYGVQLLGGHGYIREYPMEKYYRNGRGISILDGIATV